MPRNRRTALGSVSVPNTPQKTGKLATQTRSTPKSSLLAGHPASKRKASASVDESQASSQKKAKATQVTKGRQEKNASTNARKELAEEDYENKPFTVECPAKPLQKKNSGDDAYRGRWGEQLGLGVDYAIRPGRWGNLKSYGVVKYEGLDLRSGDFAYFAKRLIAPREIPEEEILASNDPLMDERENNYLGMITEARAEESTRVFLKVMYAYWPEELPQGRQSYHGMKEVVMSNHMDILDAHTIVGKVEVEKIDDTVESVEGIYWRQTLDISKFPRGKGKQPGVLSKLKGHCRCRQPMNPDQTVYICRYCTLWNHDHCLIDDVLEKAWEKYMVGTLGQDDDEDTLKEEEVDSIEVISQQKKKSPLMSSIKSMASGLFGGSPAPTTVDAREKANIGTNAESTKGLQLDGPTDVKASKTMSAKDTRNRKERVRKPGKSAPWNGKLSATIDSTGKFAKAGLVVAQIVDEDSGETVYTTVLSCFQCERRLD